MKKNTIILIVVLVVLAAIGLSVFNRKAVEAPVVSSSTASSVAPVSDTPDAIDQDLNSIDTGVQMDADLDPRHSAYAFAVGRQYRRRCRPITGAASHLDPCNQRNGRGRV